MLSRRLLLCVLLLSVLASGKVPRSRAARAAFQRQNPCPATGKKSGSCPGFVVDHVIAIRCGGPDKPSNMQWQTKADAKAKDKIEKNCTQEKK